jgi:heterodisulfide reductase subunit B2
MRVGYFPGCSLHGMEVEYDESLHVIAKAFGIELEEVKDWNCCGSTAAHTLNKLLSIALPSRILALAEKQGMDELMVPCAACYSRLMSARHEFLMDEKLRKKIPEMIEMPFTGSTRPINVMEFIEKHIVPNIGDKIQKPFTGKVACYYGCLLVRPPKLTQVENYENPQMMENIMKKLGATTIDWAFKTECCGAGLSLTQTDIVAKLSGKIVEDAINRGAEAIIVACPMCQTNLDLRRNSIDSFLKKKTQIPVLYITQAIGMSLGLESKKIGFHRHFVPVDSIALTKPKAVPEKKPQPVKEVV